MQTLRVTRIISAVIVCALSAPTLVHPAAPQSNSDESRIVVTDVTGTVNVSTAGVPTAIDVSSTLALPSRIVTGHDGMLGIRQARTSISIAPDSDIAIPAEAVDGNLIARLVQYRGNAFYDVAPREVSKLRVETPYLVAVIKGTQFNVAVQEDSTTISLFEGRLEIRTPDDSEVIQLNPGEIAIRSRTDDAIRVIGMDDDRLPAQRANNARVAGDAALAADRDENGTARGAASLDVDAVRVTRPGVLALADDAVAAIDIGRNAPALNLERSTLDAGSISLEPALSAATLGTSVGVDVGALDTGLAAAVDLGAGTIDAGLGASVDLGGASLEAGLTAGVDLGGGALDVGLDAGVDAGVASADVGLDAGIDLAGGSVAVGADAGIDVGVVGADLGVAAGVDLGAGSIDVGLAADADLGGVAAADLGIDASLDTGGGIDLGVDTSVAVGGLDASVGVDAGTDQGLAVDLGVAGLDVGVNLGGNEPLIDLTPSEPTGGGSGSGLLGGLGGLLGRP